MINIQAFSRKNLVSTSPFLRKLQSKALLNKEAMAVAESIQTHTFEFGELNRKISNGKPTFFFTDLASKLVESKVNDNLKRGYNVRPNDRNITVSQIKTLLSESCPFHVLKLDVKDFFESVNRDKLIKSICSEMTVSSETQWLLKSIVFYVVLGLRRRENVVFYDVFGVWRRRLSNEKVRKTRGFCTTKS